MIKRAIDIILSLFALTVLFVPGLVVVVILKLTGERQAFYFQPRIGQRKQTFTCWKLVTMRTGSEKTGTGAITIKNDPRVTPLGKFLRKTKINELPQIFNVLKGDMSLVGPRPLTPEGFGFYTPEVQDVIGRVKPGLTGIGSIVFRDEEQLLGKIDKPYEQVYREDISPYKGALECWYVEHQSLWLDLKLILLTPVVIFLPNSKVYRRLVSDLPERPAVSVLNSAGPPRRPRLLLAANAAFGKTLIRGQIRYATCQGFDVFLIIPPGPKIEEFAETEGATLFIVPMKREISLLHDIVSLLRIIRALRQIQPDVINAGTPKAGLLVMMAAKLCHIDGRIFTLRGLRSATLTGIKGYIVRKMEKMSCVLAQRVICISPSMKTRGVQLGYFSDDKAVVFGSGSSNGIDSRVFSRSENALAAGRTLRSELGIHESANLIGFVGRLVRDKGVVELLEAWKSIREQNPLSHLLIVGPFETGDPIPQQYIDLISDDPRIHSTGFLDNPVAAYAAMDLLVLPTYREGFGNVLVEAAAMELPTVATRVDGCVDAVVDGQTGTLVPARDSCALVEAIIRYLNDPELRQQHGRAGRERVMREFTQERIWSEQINEYVRMLEGKLAPIPRLNREVTCGV